MSTTYSANKPYESEAQFEARLRKRLQTLIVLSIAVLVVVVFFFPVYFMVVSSFKAEREIQSIPFHWLPTDFQGIGQYQRAFEVGPVARWFANSMVVAVAQVAGTVIFGAMAGYGFAKYNFRFKQALFLLILSIMAIPFQILLIPLYVLIRQFSWDDTYTALIMPGLITSLGVFMMRQFAYGIPDELLDAARIDGASELRIFWRIAFPLLAPASASLAIITFLYSWNAFLWPLVAIQNRNLATLPVGMTIFTQPYRGDPVWGPALAVSTLATLPIALLFVFFQRYFVQGMLISGIKG